MAAPNRMNFRESSKGGEARVISIQKFMLQVLGTLNRAFWAWNWCSVESNLRVQSMFFFNNCIEKNQNKTHFEEGSSSSSLSYQSKGPVPLSNQMNFSKRQLGPTPHSTWFPIFGNHEQTCISYYLVLVPPCIYWTISIINNLQHNYPKIRGVQRPFGFFPKIHPIWFWDPSFMGQKRNKFFLIRFFQKKSCSLNPVTPSRM